MENNNNNNGDLKSKAGGEGLLLSVNECMGLDLNVPVVEISSEPSLINFMAPHSQVPASNNDFTKAMGGSVDFEAQAENQDPLLVLALSYPPQGGVHAQASNNNEMIVEGNDNNNNNNNPEIPVPSVEAGLKNKGMKRKYTSLKGSRDYVEAMRCSDVKVIDLTYPVTIDKLAKALMDLDYAVEVPGLSSVVAATAHLRDHAEEPTAPAIFSMEGDELHHESTPERKLSDLLVEYAWSPKRFSQPRFVIQILSDVDKVDDGYDWKKYGQKHIKGLGSFPRCYYRCKVAGCPVRKQVERPPYDTKHMIITYEGKHNHPEPFHLMEKKSSSYGVENAVFQGQPQLGNNYDSPGFKFAQSFNNSNANMSMSDFGSSSSAPNMNNPSLKNIGSNGMMRPYYGSYHDQFVAPHQAEPVATSHGLNQTSRLALNLRNLSSDSHQGEIDPHSQVEQSLYLGGHFLLKPNDGGFLRPNNNGA